MNDSGLISRKQHDMEKNKELYELLTFAQDHIPFYRDNVKIDKNNCGCIYEYFSKIPIINKQVIKANYIDFIDEKYHSKELEKILSDDIDFKKEKAHEVAGEELVTEYTTGSSGTPFLSIKTKKERFMLANYLNKIRNSFVKVRPEEMFCFIHNFDRLEYPFPFDRLEDTESKIDKEFKYLNDNGFKWWHINSNRLAYYSDWVEQKKVTFPTLNVIENNGAYLSQEEKERYADVFNCRIVDHYGCREVWTIAFDCKNGYKHVNEDFIYFELVDENNNVIHENGKPGNVVITSLKQRCMPFIRYKLEDIAYYVPGDCDCGCKGKRIELLPGRNRIKGTDIYGNMLFKKVILDLVHKSNIMGFDDISVKQIGLYQFEVNVKGLKSSKEEFEEAFSIHMKHALSDDNYSCSFTYNLNSECKSIFEIRM